MLSFYGSYCTYYSIPAPCNVEQRGGATRRFHLRCAAAASALLRLRATRLAPVPPRARRSGVRARLLRRLAPS
eukprot:6209052-Pleurochrysis_carterae.AAC.4